MTSSWNPTANSIAERVHSTLGNCLRIYKSTLSVDDIIERAERNINYTYHKSIKCCPIEIINSKHPINLSNKMLQIEVEKNYAMQLENKKKSLDKRNKNRSKCQAICKGDMVMIRKMPRNSKLDVVWEGPFIVEDTYLSNNVIIVTKDQGTEKVNVKRVRKIKQVEKEGKI